MKTKKICVKVVVTVCVVCMIACACLMATGCEKTQYFGQFGYKGKMLKEYAVLAINAERAKEIIQDVLPEVSAEATSTATFASCTLTSSVAGDFINIESRPSQDLVNAVLSKYGECIVTTKYYVEDSNKQHTKVDHLVGSDLKHVLELNEFSPFGLLTAKNILVYDDLIDYMEDRNAAFVQSDEAKLAPFKAIFSYHEDKSGHLIVQTRDFAEIPSSVGGGIGCSYRQDTEIVYDEEGKMALWQTSLGLYSSTPEGTMKDGYILEMSVEWVEKD